MKTRSIAYIKFFVSALIAVLAAFWVVKTDQPFNSMAYIVLGVMIFLSGFALYQGIRALKNERAGLKPEDELSRRIKEKAAATAYKVSIFMWLFCLLFVIDLIPVHTIAQAKIIVAFGMVGMTLIFIITWLYLSKVGISDENKD